MPARSSASTTLVSESITPRTLPSLASMRWMVGSDTPANPGELSLVDPEQRARSAHLCGGDHKKIPGLNHRIPIPDISIDA